MTTRRRIGVIGITWLVLGLIGLIAPLRAPAAEAERFRVDDSTYNGSFSALGFYTIGNERLYTLRHIRAVVELPKQWANSFCSYARVGVNGVVKGESIRDCDTNGDATLTLLLPDMYASKSDHIEVWFSDPVTRFNVRHPIIIL